MSQCEPVYERAGGFSPTIADASEKADNGRGEPIVCSPTDAYRCFMRTEMDYLVIENFLLSKADQPVQEQDDSWQDEFELD